MVTVTPTHNWVRKVRRFVSTPSQEHCDFCRAAIPAGHPHLLDLAGRRLSCACEACAASVPSRADSAYRLVPQRAHVLHDLRLTDAEWEALQIPIGMAFLFHSTPDARPVALYPGPAGATESLLDLESWSGLVASNPALAELQPDVEALLVNRTKGRRDYYRVPIDRCYLLVGLLRTHWRGLSGGAEAWEAIERFFARLREADGGARDGGARDRAHG
jgi:hypothetical protein